MNKIFSLIFSTVFIGTAAVASPVNINQANAEQISLALNGIGLVKAQAIVDFREKNGNYSKLEDLSKVKGIGEKLLTKVAEDVLLK